MSKRLDWGIIGTGNIARQFAAGVMESDRGVIAAVGSRQLNTAREFAQPRGIETAYGSYNQVLVDAGVDAVYISLPNSMHHEWTIKALRAGKHVLCEKPIALNAQQAREMFDEARRANRVLVEAFMYRAHPLTHQVLASVRSGAIGEVRLIRSSFCYCTNRTEGNVRFVRELGGGGLMDIGCYCINFSRMIAGIDPVSASATAHFHSSGVDDVAAGTLIFPGGIVASFTCGMTVHADNTAYICGSEGYIEVSIPWKPPKEKAAYVIADSTPPKMDQEKSESLGVGSRRAGMGRADAPPQPREMRYVDAGMDLYGLEADDFAATVLDGKPPFLSEDETIGNMRVLDELRGQIEV